MPDSDTPPSSNREPRHLAIVGAGPVGLALAIVAAGALPDAAITVFDARPADRDVSTDPRTLALSLGSVQLLRRLRAWPVEDMQPIAEVDVSQQPPSAGPLLERWLGEPRLRIRAGEEGVSMLGAVVAYGRLVAALQRTWFELSATAPQRLRSAFGQPVNGLRPEARGVELDAGVVQQVDLAVVAEGGVFGGQQRRPVHADYAQSAWVGTVQLPAHAPIGIAYERFTRQGPVALLPLPRQRAALVWCVASDDDPVAGLDDRQRLAVLEQLLPDAVRPLQGLSPLKCFPLGLNAQPTLADGRIVRIGNAAQTLHPVAGQGLNLGLRDAWELVRLLRDEHDIDRALRRLEWRRGPDRWSMIATTDFLARAFTWTLPGAGVARGLGLAALQALGPVRSALARQMMFGSR